jgi:hypothetical protein
MLFSRQQAMAASKKTDNHDPRAKLLLRRYFLEKYHADGNADVLDCCQAGGLLWTEICKTHEVFRYWGVDLKPKKGRLKIDSVRILQQPGWPQNVIDIDTYGEPWKHWSAMLPNITQPVTVFLTIGKPILAAGGRSLSNAERESVGINFKIPAAFGPKLVELSTDFMLAKSLKSARIIECVEASSTGNARYIGVRLEPIKNGSLAVDATSKPKHRKANKEQCNV